MEVVNIGGDMKKKYKIMLILGLLLPSLISILSLDFLNLSARYLDHIIITISFLLICVSLFKGKPKIKYTYLYFAIFYIYELIIPITTINNNLSISQYMNNVLSYLLPSYYSSLLLLYSLYNDKRFDKKKCWIVILILGLLPVINWFFYSIYVLTLNNYVPKIGIFDSFYESIGPGEIISIFTIIIFLIKSAELKNKKFNYLKMWQILLNVSLIVLLLFLLLVIIKRPLFFIILIWYYPAVIIYTLTTIVASAINIKKIKKKKKIVAN